MCLCHERALSCGATRNESGAGERAIARSAWKCYRQEAAHYKSHYYLLFARSSERIDYKKTCGAMPLFVGYCGLFLINYFRKKKTQKAYIIKQKHDSGWAEGAPRTALLLTPKTRSL